MSPKKPVKKRALKRSPGATRRSSRKGRAKVTAARSKFSNDLIARGEATAPDALGNLPSDATHVVVDTPDGPAVQRVRFKLT